MADFNTNILINADVRRALLAVEKLEGSVRDVVNEAEKFEQVFKRIAAGPSNKVALARQRQLAGAIAEQNKLLVQQVVLASQLASRYDGAAAAAADFTRSIQRAQQASQKLLRGGFIGQRALPGAGGSSQKLLPAAGQTGRGGFQQAGVRAAEIDRANAAIAENVRAANLLTTTIYEEIEAKRRGIRAVEQVTASNTRAQRLLPGTTDIRGGQTSGPAGAPATTPFAGNRKQQILQREVDRQISVTGRVSKELSETVASYNKLQTETDRLVKTTGRLSTELNKEVSKRKSSGGTGGGGGGRNVLGSALVGGAFPALFGGGPGAILGGFVGELFGPLLGVVGSAIGSQFDKIGQSAIELGQALGGLEPDINRLISGIGLAGTSAGQLIKGIEKAEGAQVAQAIAAERMAGLVGIDAVNALRDAGDAASELGREASQAFTALAAALAPALEAVADFLAKNIQEQRQLSRVDPGIFGAGAGDLAGNQEVQQVRRDFAQGAISETEARNRLLEIVREIEAVESRIFDQRLQSYRTLQESYDQVRQQYELSQSALDVARLGGDIKQDNVYKAEQENIKLQFATRYQELLNEAVSTEADRRIINLKLLALENKELAALANLENRRKTALEAAAKRSSGSAGAVPESRALSLQQQIIREELKREEIRFRALRILRGEEAALKAQQQALENRLQKEVQIIELQRSQALERNKVAADVPLINQFYNDRIQTLSEELQLQNLINDERLRAIQLERDLRALQADQELQGISTGLNRELEDIQSRIANPFGGFEAEQSELLVEQARRYSDVMTNIENQQERLLAQRNEANKLTIDPQLQELERQKQLYQEMLPAIAAAEQQELKLQQTLQMLQPITDNLASGIANMFTALVDGSKSAEEAFADMLKGMGQALIQTASQMIAEYIAIGIARMFAFGDTGKASNPFPLGAGFPSFAGRAEGGPVKGNTPYVVGEVGPELFIPKEAGTVVPNDRLMQALERMAEPRMSGGAVMPNQPYKVGEAGTEVFIPENPYATARDAMVVSSRTVTTKTQEKKEEQAIEAMEQSISGDINVRYESTVINEQTYVTEEQFRQGLKKGAKQARAETMKQFRNSPAVRGKAGV